jgi:hypothetical protein
MPPKHFQNAVEAEQMAERGKKKGPKLFNARQNTPCLLLPRFMESQALIGLAIQVVIFPLSDCSAITSRLSRACCMEPKQTELLIAACLENLMCEY